MTVKTAGQKKGAGLRYATAGNGWREHLIDPDDTALCGARSVNSISKERNLKPNPTPQCNRCLRIHAQRTRKAAP